MLLYYSKMRTNRNFLTHSLYFFLERMKLREKWGHVKNNSELPARVYPELKPYRFISWGGGKASQSPSGQALKPMFISHLVPRVHFQQKLSLLCSPYYLFKYSDIHKSFSSTRRRRSCTDGEGRTCFSIPVIKYRYTLCRILVNFF